MFEYIEEHGLTTTHFLPLGSDVGVVGRSSAAKKLALEEVLEIRRVVLKGVLAASEECVEPGGVWSVNVYL